MTFAVEDILALIESPDVVGDQWRIVRPFTRLRQTGIDARWAWGDGANDVPVDPERTVLVVPRMSGTNESTIDHWLYERRSNVRTIVYEMDDIQWGEPMLDHLQGANFMQGKTADELLHDGEMSRYFASRCDGVTVSSEPLAALMRESTDAPVIVVPNAIDTRWFRAQMAHRAPWAHHVTIGWSGGRRPERDVVPMAQAWGRIARRYPEVRFVVAAAIVPDVIYREVEDDTRVIRLPWLSWHDYPVAYQTTIGCCAVADTPFSRAKTPIKWMEYATAGAAVVATPTLYGDVIEDGSSGVLAQTADEWEAALVRLIEDEDERRFIRDVAESYAERYYGLDVNIGLWTDAYAQIVGARERLAA